MHGALMESFDAFPTIGRLDGPVHYGVLLRCADLEFKRPCHYLI